MLFACNNTQKEISPSEILTEVIKIKLSKENINGNYIFVCGPYCRGCVQQTVLTLDSVYSKLNNNEQWVFITSHKFIEELPLKNIKFIYDYDWENVNYDFRETMYFKFVNDSIVYSKIITEKSDVQPIFIAPPS